MISNHDCFRVLFDKIESVCFIWKNIFIFWHWKRPARGNKTVPILSAHFLSLYLLFIGRDTWRHLRAGCSSNSWRNCSWPLLGRLTGRCPVAAQSVSQITRTTNHRTRRAALAVARPLRRKCYGSWRIPLLWRPRTAFITCLLYRDAVRL